MKILFSPRTSPGEVLIDWQNSCFRISEGFLGARRYLFNLAPWRGGAYQCFLLIRASFTSLPHTLKPWSKVPLPQPLSLLGTPPPPHWTEVSWVGDIPESFLNSSTQVGLQDGHSVTSPISRPQLLRVVEAGVG